MDAIAFPSIDEQERILTEARNGCKRSAFQMRKAIDEDNMREALKFSSAMLGELRTSQLSPQKYYELYMQAFDQLVKLESFFGEERSKGRSFTELYELVQHAGNVLPRLYLMVAVGCLYIKSGEARAADILRDLVEMCKGVQHPTRGLFLRSYLCQRSRGLLPDVGSPYEGAGGSISDALHFLLSNFTEMNKLWVRMQHQGSLRDKDKREKERSQLQDLVGKNLTYLSQLDGLDFELYQGEVLPCVIEQVVSCKDDLAQQYLMQCVIQGFPDKFHLGTLDVLLGALPELQPGVKIHTAMASLMDRLAKYAGSEPSVMTQLLDMGAFEKFRDAISRVLAAQPSMAAGDAVEMYVALMNFTGSVHPNIVSNVNQVLAAAYAALSSRGLTADPRAEKQLVALLTLPLAKYDVVTGLGLTEYPLLMSLLRHRTHKELATRIIGTVLECGTLITSVERVGMLFRFVQPLVAEPAGQVQAEDLDDEDVEEEQLLVARLLHNLVNSDPDEHFAILQAAAGHLAMGGPRRTRHTTPALIFCTLQLMRRTISLTAAASAVKASPVPASVSDAADATASATAGQESGDVAAAAAGIEKLSTVEEVAAAVAEPAHEIQVTPEAMLQWILSLVLGLVNSDSPPVSEPMMALRLLLSAAHAASEEAGLELLAYEFFEQAFTLYEESLPDQRLRTTALQAIVGTLGHCYVFGPDNRDALCGAVSGYSAKLLKRPDQCRAVAAASHLSWQEDPPTPRHPAAHAPVRDSPKVMACMARAIKVANAAKQQAAAARPPGQVARCNTPMNTTSPATPIESSTIPSPAAAPASRSPHIALYIEILNQYLYYYDKGAGAFTTSAVQGIIDLIQNEMASTTLTSSTTTSPLSSSNNGGGDRPASLLQPQPHVEVEATQHWRATVSHIRRLALTGEGEARERYAALKLHT